MFSLKFPQKRGQIGHEDLYTLISLNQLPTVLAPHKLWNVSFLFVQTVCNGPILTSVSVPSQDKQLSLMVWGRKVKQKGGKKEGKKKRKKNRKK